MAERHFLRKIWSEFAGSKASLYGAGACFYLIVSILPTTMLLLALTPHVPVLESLVRELLRQLLPQALLPVAAELLEPLRQFPSPAVLSLSGLTLLWSASKGLQAMTDGFHAVLGLDREAGFVHRRLQAMANALLLLPGILILPAVSLFSQLLGPRLFWRRLLTAAMLGCLFSLLYRLLPRQQFPFRCCLQCGLLIGGCWVLFSYGYSIYVSCFSSYTSHYGGMGLAVLGAVWLHSCLTLLLYGAMLTKRLSASGKGLFSLILAQLRGRS